MSRPHIEQEQGMKSDNKKLSCAERADGGGDGSDNIVWFLYTGQPNTAIPRDVTHARIDPSVKRIGAL